MTPVARLDPNLTPAGPAERVLYDTIVARYEPITDFVREIAKTRFPRARKFETEKKALYRYINGGSSPRWRVAAYAQILGIDVATITRPSDPPNRDLTGLQADLDAVKAQVAKIQLRLDQGQGPPRSAGGTP